MNNRAFFSLIIPCYNSINTIHRVMDSIDRQGIDLTDLEIIVVDDCSSDQSYMNVVNSYGYPIKWAKTSTEIHCPGNTRREGMKHVTGKWVCFCDHDDYFEDNALKQVKEHIENCKDEPLVVSTILSSYDETKHLYRMSLPHKAAWLHGKFYNYDAFIDPYGINFKEDLKTHEDIYFNSLCLSVLYRIGKDFDYYDIQTYRWVEEASSITRRPRTDRGYMLENFNDYIVAASDPYWDYAIESRNPIFVNQVMMTFLHCYFYYEAVSYYNGPSQYKDILADIKVYFYSILKDFEMSLDDVVDYLYLDPARYHLVEEDCRISVGFFIPKTSLRDFVYHIGKDHLR